MGYRLSKRSLSNLEGVHEDLVQVVKRAILITGCDFMVAEGLRSKARQRQLVDAGDSWTLNSRHLTGHAVDLWAYVAGDISWNWDHYFTIAEAMRKAAGEQGVSLRWGGLWDLKLEHAYRPLPALQEEYVAEFRSRNGRGPKLDGPHFELHWDSYPSR